MLSQNSNTLPVISILTIKVLVLWLLSNLSEEVVCQVDLISFQFQINQTTLAENFS